MVDDGNERGWGDSLVIERTRVGSGVDGVGV